MANEDNLRADIERAFAQVELAKEQQQPIAKQIERQSRLELLGFA